MLVVSNLQFHNMNLEVTTDQGHYCCKGIELSEIHFYHWSPVNPMGEWNDEWYIEAKVHLCTLFWTLKVYNIQYVYHIIEYFFVKVHIQYTAVVQ